MRLTLSRVSAETPSPLPSARETVKVDTPALSLTSRSVTRSAIRDSSLKLNLNG